MSEQVGVRHRVRRQRGVARTTLFSRPTEDENNKSDVFETQKGFQSNALADPYQGLYQSGTSGGFTVLSPPENPTALLKMPNISGVLRQCIDAMVTNTCAFGYRVEYIGPEGQEESPAAKVERDRITSLLEQPNGEYSFADLKERVRRDKETFGYTFYEIGRELDRSIVLINHVPAHTLRMTAKDAELVTVNVWLKRGGKLLKIPVQKRFRRFVQQVGNRTIYFKEFGDPRPINPQTGKVDETLSLDKQATEIYHDALYSPGTAYGLPRWISEVTSMLGNREAALTNLHYFKDNAVPAMAILVSGGQLTGDSLNDIEEHFTFNRGRDAQNRVLVIEAVGDGEAADSDGKITPPRLEIKPLSGDRQGDALFEKYEEANERKIRACFRLPPIFVGRADDYSRATADTSLVMADGQVFGPERSKDDDTWNTHFLTEDGRPLQFYALRTNPPRLANPEQLLKALETLDKLGGLTPNIAVGIANELFDLAIPEIKEPWGDFPFPLVLELAKKGRLGGLDAILAEIEPGDGETTPTPEEKAAAEEAAKANKPEPGDQPVARKRIRRMIAGQFSALAEAA